MKRPNPIVITYYDTNYSPSGQIEIAELYGRRQIRPRRPRRFIRWSPEFMRAAAKWQELGPVGDTFDLDPRQIEVLERHRRFLLQDERWAPKK